MEYTLYYDGTICRAVFSHSGSIFGPQAQEVNGKGQVRFDVHDIMTSLTWYFFNLISSLKLFLFCVWWLSSFFQAGENYRAGLQACRRVCESDENPLHLNTLCVLRKDSCMWPNSAHPAEA